MKEVETIAVVNPNEVIKFNDFNNVAEMMSYAQTLIDSKLVAFRKPEEVVLVANLGKALGVSFEVAALNMFSVQGKPTLSVHLQTALARKAGVDWELIKDAEKVYDDNGKAIDMITTIKFYRFNNALQRVTTNEISYRWSDAVAAGLSTKDNWKTKARQMLRARALADGIRFVASDVLMGVFYETGEMLDTTNKTYDIDDEGNAIIA
jgi:hypothetical protein